MLPSEGGVTTRSGGKGPNTQQICLSTQPRNLCRLSVKCVSFSWDRRTETDSEGQNEGTLPKKGQSYLGLILNDLIWTFLSEDAVFNDET